MRLKIVVFHVTLIDNILRDDSKPESEAEADAEQLVDHSACGKHCPSDILAVP